MIENYRIMKVYENFDCDNKTIFYRAACGGCLSEDCDISIELEYSRDFNQIYMNFYKKISISTWGYSFFSRLWTKIKTTFNIWFKGYVEMEESFIFTDEEQMWDFSNVIRRGGNLLRERVEADNILNCVIKEMDKKNG